MEADILRALTDPTRRAVFEHLVRREWRVSELKAGFSVSQPAISQHLAALRRVGLVSERRNGRFAFYRAEPEGVNPLIDWIDWTDNSMQCANSPSSRQLLTCRCP